MEIFKYTKLASDSGKDGLLALAIFAAIALFIIYKLSTKPDGLFGKSSLIVLSMLAVFGFVAVKTVFTRLQSTGEWQIIVDDQTLQWNAPQELDKSFTVNLLDIQLFKIIKDRDAGHNTYELMMTDGSVIELSDDLGMDFGDFSKALKERGVEVEKIKIQTSE